MSQLSLITQITLCGSSKSQEYWMLTLFLIIFKIQLHVLTSSFLIKLEQKYKNNIFGNGANISFWNLEDNCEQITYKISKKPEHKLVSVGVHIDDEEILHIVLQELHTLIKTEEDLLKSAMDNSKEIAQMAMVANKNSQPTFNNLLNAQFNDNRGRGKNQNRGRVRGGGKFQNYNNGCGGFNQGSFQEWRDNILPAELTAMATAAPTCPNQTTWISDTGATDHFTPDLNNIPDNQAYTGLLACLRWQWQSTSDLPH
uniref:Uncharacterized protein n=1 Tax=Fagus sylvatica TaxID=28930 RepID=A0A2N9J3B1_FAGSY